MFMHFTSNKMYYISIVGAYAAFNFFTFDIVKSEAVKIREVIKNDNLISLYLAHNLH